MKYNVILVHPDGSGTTYGPYKLQDATAFAMGALFHGEQKGAYIRKVDSNDS